jgi:hypothetical protein
LAPGAVEACQSNSTKCGASLMVNQLVFLQLEPSVSKDARSW